MGDRFTVRSSVPFSGRRLEGGGGFDPPLDRDDDDYGGGVGSSSDPGGAALFFLYVALLFAASLLPLGLVEGPIVQYICAGALLGLVAVLALELFRTCRAAFAAGASPTAGRRLNRYERIPDLPVAEPVEDEGGGGTNGASGTNNAAVAPEASAFPIAEPLLAIVVNDAVTFDAVASVTPIIRVVALPDS